MNSLEDITNFHLYALSLFVDQWGKDHPKTPIPGYWIIHMSKLLSGNKTDSDVVEKKLLTDRRMGSYLVLTFLSKDQAGNLLVTLLANSCYENDHMFRSFYDNFYCDHHHHEETDSEEEESPSDADETSLDIRSMGSGDVKLESSSSDPEENDEEESDDEASLPKTETTNEDPDHDAFRELGPWASPFSTDASEIEG